jgi:hypothetical protein
LAVQLGRWSKAALSRLGRYQDPRISRTRLDLVLRRGRGFFGLKARSFISLGCWKAVSKSGLWQWLWKRTSFRVLGVRAYHPTPEKNLDLWKLDDVPDLDKHTPDHCDFTGFRIGVTISIMQFSFPIRPFTDLALKHSNAGLCVGWLESSIFIPLCVFPQTLSQVHADGIDWA